MKRKKTPQRSGKHDAKILRLICREFTMKEIAPRVGLSVDRVKQIRGELIKVTKSRGMVGLVKYSIKNKIFILK
jgi:hypothetical protein